MSRQELRKLIGLTCHCHLHHHLHGSKFYQIMTIYDHTMSMLWCGGGDGRTHSIRMWGPYSPGLRTIGHPGSELENFRRDPAGDVSVCWEAKFHLICEMRFSIRHFLLSMKADGCSVDIGNGSRNEYNRRRHHSGFWCRGIQVKTNRVEEPRSRTSYNIFRSWYLNVMDQDRCFEMLKIVWLR